MMVGNGTDVADRFGRSDSIFAVFAKSEHMADALEEAGLFGAGGSLAFAALVQRALEGTVSVDEAAFGVTWTVLKEPRFSGF